MGDTLEERRRYYCELAANALIPACSQFLKTFVSFGVARSALHPSDGCCPSEASPSAGSEKEISAGPRAWDRA
jgi:hypothetical protein